MRCEDRHAELSAWIDGELTADERARIAEHLHTCAACSAYVRALQDTSSLVRGLRAPRAPASVTQAAMRQIARITQHGNQPWSRWRVSFAWPIPALGVGLAGLAAAVTVAVLLGWQNFLGWQDGANIPGANSLKSAPASAGSPLPNGAGYHLSSAPDSVTGAIPITPGYDFRGGKNPRDISTLNARERYAWDRGVWRHQRRFGRDGWWWDVKGAWYWYDKPAAGPPTVVSDIRFAADSASNDAMQQPPAKATGPAQTR